MNGIFALSRKIKDTVHKSNTITDSTTIGNIKNIINNFPAPKKRKLSELKVNTNVKDWIISIFDDYPKIYEKEAKYLLNDFSDSMKTRMRSEDKYAIIIILENEIILCHSTYGEETITPQWETIQRMVDSDNILRYVKFIKENDDIMVEYYEKNATNSFIEWLGLPNKEAFYFGGKYRIYSKIHGTTIIFELTEDEIDDWIKNHPEIKRGMIKYSKPINQFPIEDLRVGKRKYTNIGNFIQDYTAEKYHIGAYTKKFKEIICSLDTITYKIYDAENEVVKINGDEKEIIVEKEKGNAEILFANGNGRGKIEIRDDYIEKLYTKFINSEELNIIHVGEEITEESVNIGSMRIFNKINVSNLTKDIIQYYENNDLFNNSVKKIIEFSIFYTLANNNKNKHINYFFELFAKKIIDEIHFGSKISEKENEILEYKSKDYFSENDKKIIEKLSNDMDKKLKNSSCKIYLIGIEDDGSINYIPKSRLKSDRIKSIELKLQEKLNKDIYLIPIYSGDGAILMIIAGDINGK